MRDDIARLSRFVSYCNLVYIKRPLSLSPKPTVSIEVQLYVTSIIVLTYARRTYGSLESFVQNSNEC